MNLRIVFIRFNEYSRSGVLAGLSGIVLSGPVFGFMLRKSYQNELAIINHAEVVRAELVEVGTSRDDPRTGDTGGALGTYRYRMLNGQEGNISISGDTLNDIPGYADSGIVEVEYLPENPSVKRVKGSGNTNLSDLRFWTVFKGVLLSIFFLVSIAMTVSGIKNR
jgi:hypothetical protein